MPSLFEVYVVPRSTGPGPHGRHDGIPRLRVAAPPVEGKANAEVERLLARLLGAPVRMVRGERARRKTLEAELGPHELEEALRRIFDGS